MQLVVISGRSGSGKSASLHALEDLGYYAIDNLPAGLLEPLVQQSRSEHGNPKKIAVSIDARNLPHDLDHFPHILQALKADGVACTVVYLNANAKTLMERFSATRRRHPLTRHDHLSLSEAIEEEQRLLEPIANLSDLLIDTTRLSVHELRNLVAERVANRSQQQTTLLFQSFGFKRGVPLDVDLMFDARCLPNPFWDTRLRPLTGLDQAVIEFLSQQSEAQAMLDDIRQYLERWLPRYVHSGRSYVTIGIGCTGGQHRSVWLTEHLGQYFKAQHHEAYPSIQIRHRELGAQPIGAGH